MALVRCVGDTAEKDLDNLIDKALNFHGHTANAINEASTMFGLVKKTFTCLDKITVPRLNEKYRDPGRSRVGQLGRPSQISALAKLSLSFKTQTHVVSNLLYSYKFYFTNSTRNCIKTIHSPKLTTPEPPQQIKIYIRELSAQHRQRCCPLDPIWSPGAITADLAESRTIPH